MRKIDELTNPVSCMSRAMDWEMTFVLLGRDMAAPAAIRAWIEERIRLGKNTRDDPQIREAEQCAASMFSEQPRLAGDLASRRVNSTQPGTAEGEGRHTAGKLRHVPEVLADGMHVAGREPKIVEDSTGVIIAEVSRHTPARGREDEAEDRARRLAAAWNAVAGITTEALEQGAVADLLAAMKFMLGKLEVALAAERRATLAPYPKSGVEYVGVDPADCEEVKQARAAIAKAEGMTQQ